MTEPRWQLIDRARAQIAQDPEGYAADPERLGVAADRIMELLDGGGDDEDGGSVLSV